MLSKVSSERRPNSGRLSLRTSRREHKQDFIKLHDTHRGHKKAPACCYGAFTSIPEYMSRNVILIVDTEHALPHLRSAAARWLVLQEYFPPYIPDGWPGGISKPSSHWLCVRCWLGVFGASCWDVAAQSIIRSSFYTMRVLAGLLKCKHRYTDTDYIDLGFNALSLGTFINTLVIIRAQPIRF